MIFGAPMFKTIHSIDDVAPFVADKKEIVFSKHAPVGMTVGCYMFMDSHTFDTLEAMECRGIAFDEHGAVASRPLHKFFNVGEKVTTTIASLEHKNLVRIFDKIDGSMIATAWHPEQGLLFRSKKSFTSSVVKLTYEMLEQEEFFNIKEFSHKVASSNMTAIFELTHPQAPIVVVVDRPSLNLLHVRDNTTGEYVMLDPKHVIHQWIEEFNIPLATTFSMSLNEVVQSLDTMEKREGYVLQFDDGDMVKIKCPWYLRLHSSITFLRERDIARAALHENLDDIKSALVEVGITLNEVESIEQRLKNRLLEVSEEVDRVYEENKHLERKDFALALNKHPYFSFIMNKFVGRENNYIEWYERRHLRDEFGLRVLVDDARAEEMDMHTPKEPSPSRIKSGL